MIAVVRGNPFVVLGLTPGAIEGLTDDQIMSLARDVYISQTALHAPENGGLKRRYQAIQEAWVALNDHDTFTKAKEAYLVPENEQVARLERQVRSLRVQLGDQANR